MLPKQTMDNLKEVLSIFLESLDFDQMAEEVLKTRRYEELKKYAAVILRNVSAPKQARLQPLFQQLNLN